MRALLRSEALEPGLRGLRGPARWMLALALLSQSALAGCADGAARCVVGAQVACACLGGASAVQTCQPGGTLGPCSCPGAQTTDSGADSVAPADATDAQLGTDAPSSIDAPAPEAGVGPDAPADAPTELATRDACAGPGCTQAIALSAGGSASAVLLADGTLRYWGEMEPAPRTLTGPTGVRQVSAGRTSCAVTGAGAVWCMGRNNRGQLGDGTTTDRATLAPVAGISDAVQVACGSEQTCARLRSGGLKCWGNLSRLMLTDGVTGDRLSPTTIPGVTGAVALAQGGGHTCVLLADRTVHCMGNNSYGQLGTDSMMDRGTLAPIPGLTDIAELSIAASTSCARTTAGEVHCWGYDVFGLLGVVNGAFSNPTPRRIMLTGATAISVGLGGLTASHVCAALRDGTARCWGNDSDGQLGDRTTGALTVPIPVRVQGLTGVVSVAAGSRHSCALLGDGTVWCWGLNDRGQLGTGSVPSSLVPLQVRW